MAKLAEIISNLFKPLFLIGQKFKEVINIEDNINFAPHEDNGPKGGRGGNVSWKHRNSNVRWTV